MKRIPLILCITWTLLILIPTFVWTYMHYDEDFAGLAVAYGLSIWMGGIALAVLLYLAVYLVRHFTNPSVTSETKKGTVKRIGNVALIIIAPIILYWVIFIFFQVTGLG